MATIQDILAAAVGGGDRRLMRGSTATGGRPVDSFRKETTEAQRSKTLTPLQQRQRATTDLEGQLALNAAALSDADYVSADAIRNPGEIGVRYQDPVANTRTVQEATDVYNRSGFQQPVNYEAGVDDRGNPITEEYFQGESGRPGGYETYQQNLARLGRQGAPDAMNYFGHSGGMTPWSTSWDRMGQERPVSYFPQPMTHTQFQAYPGQPDQVVPIMNPYSPYSDSAEGHALHMAPNTYNPFLGIEGGRGVDLTVSQLNAQRAANAIAARNNYNRYWAAMNNPMSYLGGF